MGCIVALDWGLDAESGYVVSVVWVHDGDDDG